MMQAAGTGRQCGLHVHMYHILGCCYVVGCLGDCLLHVAVSCVGDGRLGAVHVTCIVINAIEFLS